jgi:hypothetical protein
MSSLFLVDFMGKIKAPVEFENYTIFLSDAKFFVST